MNDPDPRPISASSGHRRTLWPNLIWGIPVAALIIVAYLGIQALAHRGVLVTVTFSHAAGARAGETKVSYQGVDAGELVDILPNKDGRRFDFQLRLKPEAKPGLNTNARFWLIGAAPSLADINSLKAAVSGVAIGYAPGAGGTATRHFQGLEKAPLILPEDKGTYYFLRATSLNAISEGTEVMFSGEPIGKVVEVHFNGKDGFRLRVFVYQPFDALVREGARFWKMSPLRLSVGGDGITANLAPIATIVSGGVGLENATADPHQPQSKPDTEFKLYGSKQAARAGLDGPTVRCRFDFTGAAGTLEQDAPVTLLGFQVGEVESTDLSYDPRTGAPHTIVTAMLYPLKLRVAAPKDPPPQDWRPATERSLGNLVKLGYRARLQQTPPLLGEESIALVKVGGRVSHAGWTAGEPAGGGTTTFPTEGGGAGLDDVLAKTDQLLGSLQHVAGRLDAMASSPELQDSLRHLHSSLAGLDQMLAKAGPDVGPLTTKLNDAAGQLSSTLSAARKILDGGGDAQSATLPEAIRQLSDAAQSIRTLTDYLSRHPESLLRGKRGEP